MIPMGVRLKLLAQEQAIREGLAEIHPPAEAERAQRIYWATRGIGDAHFNAWLMASGIGVGISLAMLLWGPLQVLFQQIAGQWGADVGTVSFFGGIVIPLCWMLICRVTIGSLYIRRRKLRLWARLDELCAKPGTPALLVQIGEADPRFREIIPDLLRQLRLV